MARSSEEVLLIINHVRHKKSDGNLYCMGERLAWMPGTRDTFTVSRHYADIRNSTAVLSPEYSGKPKSLSYLLVPTPTVQKISPDTKEKIQLQVVMHDGGADTFHFANPKGREAAQLDRHGVKELLQQLLPKFRNKLNSELEEKNRLLQEDPELFQLYKDLVVSGVVTAEQFWADRVKKQTNAINTCATRSQEVGVSAAFLADIKPQTDGCNGLKYNLTPDIIESIFRTYPAVRQKHAENVPDKLSEAEFWTRFFQSHYFHRDRINFSNKDLFADCVHKDEEVLQKELSTPKPDALLDLTAMSDSFRDEGYIPDTANEDTSKPCTQQVNASLIRRFNQHSTMVLKACSQSTQSSDLPSVESQQSNGTSNHVLGKHSAASEHTVGEPPPSKKARLKEKLEYVDLCESEEASGNSSLSLARMDRYLQGPTPALPAQYNSTQDVIQACQALREEVDAWHPNLTKVLQNNVAVSIMGELSAGGSLMQGHTHQQLSQMIPTEMRDEVKNLYSALGELLRHYWACYPTTSSGLEEKLVRMRTSLERFQVTKLSPLKERLNQYHYSINLLSHLEEMLGAAYTKFNTWQMRRLGKK